MPAPCVAALLQQSQKKPLNMFMSLNKFHTNLYKLLLLFPTKLDHSERADESKGSAFPSADPVEIIWETGPKQVNKWKSVKRYVDLGGRGRARFDYGSELAGLIRIEFFIILNF